MSAGTASLWSTLLFFGFLIFFPAEKKNITAESGQNVTLSCQAPNTKTRRVNWSRADLTDKYVLLYQGSDLDPANQHPSFKNRVDLQDRQMKDGDVSLILKDVTINDAGRYVCAVYMEDTQLWENIGSITLRVLPPPELKTITAMSGQDVTLTCRAPNNNIRHVKWSRAELKPEYVLLYRDGKFVPDNQHPSFKNRVDLQDRQMKDGDVSLILKDVTINDAGTYECCLFMSETDPFKHKLVYLRVVDPPDHKSITAESGQDVTLTCRAPRHNRGVKWSRTDLGDKYVLFYRDREFQTVDQHPSFKNRVDLQDRQMKDGDVSLILKDVTINDAGTYECHVFMKESRSWKHSVIFLSVRPSELKTITAESGQDVTLTCRAPRHNRGVKWSRADLGDKYVLLYQDREFQTDNQHPSFKNRVDLQDRQMKDGDVSLILKDVTINDAGTYECHVFMNETRSWKHSVIFLSVRPSGLPGGFIGLIVAVLILLVTIIGFLIYISYKLSRYSKDCPTQNNQALQTDKDRQE